MTRSPATLRAIGESLYGSDWQTELARAVGVSPRSVHRWATGVYRVPESAWASLAAICEARGIVLAGLARRLRKAA